MIDVSDAEPQDIYVDKHGRLWRVRTTCKIPTVCMELIEKYPMNSEDAGTGQINAGVSGLIWEGFKRIYRHSEDGEIVTPVNGDGGAE